MKLSFYLAKLIEKMQIPALRNCTISKKAKVSSRGQFQNVIMDDYSYVGKAAVLSDVIIGKFCSIGGYSQIGGGMHPTDWISTSPCFTSGKSSAGRNFAFLPFTTSETVVIENDVWIGVGVYIKPGVHIGNGAIIGAHAVVTHDVAPYSVVVGMPAKEIRKRFDQETIERIQAIKWWDWPDEQLDKYGKLFSEPERLLSVAENEITRG